MCGIAGFWKNNLVIDFEKTSNLMAKCLEHRGPDNKGVWFDKNIGLALIHRRLSVIDTSSFADQPMVSDCGNYYLIFNGEIYNYKEIRKNLIADGFKISWKSTSDSEVLLYALKFYGIKKTLRMLKGMFAFSFYNKKCNLMQLARDRMGEKPLYYGKIGKSFVFSSELKAIKSFPGFDKAIDLNALNLYFRYHYVPHPSSIFKGISKLPQGCFVTIKGNGEKVSHPCQYWSYEEERNKLVDYIDSSDKVVLDKFKNIMLGSVESMMISDVPIGAFLSGGIDSSLVVSMMQSLSNRPIETFNIGFNVKEFDESIQARKISKYLGTNHNELVLTSKDALNIAPIVSSIWDEPFSDPSQIPTYILNKFAKKNVTVCLTGDGGDELFYGYSRYLLFRKFTKIQSLMPSSLAPLMNNIKNILFTNDSYLYSKGLKRKIMH